MYYATLVIILLTLPWYRQQILYLNKLYIPSWCFFFLISSLVPFSYFLTFFLLSILYWIFLIRFAALHSKNIFSELLYKWLYIMEYICLCRVFLPILFVIKTRESKKIFGVGMRIFAKILRFWTKLWYFWAKKKMLHTEKRDKNFQKLNKLQLISYCKKKNNI